MHFTSEMKNFIETAEKQVGLVVQGTVEVVTVSGGRSHTYPINQSFKRGRWLPAE